MVEALVKLVEERNGEGSHAGIFQVGDGLGVKLSGNIKVEFYHNIVVGVSTPHSGEILLYCP